MASIRAKTSSWLRVYIAGPYSKGDVAVNVRRATLVADELLDLGYAPYVPHLTHFWHLVAPRPYEEWLALDLLWLEACDILLRLHGESAGADGEVQRAIDLDIPVVHSTEELLARFPKMAA